PTEHVELDGGWRYDGTVDGILDANRLALDELKRGRIGADLTSASVQGRVQIHPTAMLYGAKIRGPAYIGPEAVLSETYVGPYTSIGAGVRLEGVEIEHSIVLRHAAIRFPGRRIEGSLVGEGAQIGRDFSLPSALRLRVGRGAVLDVQRLDERQDGRLRYDVRRRARERAECGSRRHGHVRAAAAAQPARDRRAREKDVGPQVQAHQALEVLGVGLVDQAALR